MNRMRPAMAFLVLAAVLGNALPAGAAEEWILKAMEAELDRSRKDLKLEGYEPAYFISYTVRDGFRYYVSGKNGAIFQSNENPSRLVNVDVRVGDYDMDSSEDGDSFFSPNQKYIPNTLAPIEKSEQALRQVLWLQTDYKYKGALISFQKVKGKLVNDPKERKVASMARAEPVKLVENAPPPKFDRKAWEAGVRRISAVFVDYPEIFDSSVEVSMIRMNRYIVNSEGTRVAVTDDYYQVFVSAVCRAEDGLLLQDTVTRYGRVPSDIPSPDALVKDARALADRLSRMRKAPLIEPATVPVLMSPEATGVFFHETIGHRLEGQRQEDEDEGRTFKTYINRKILPDFISLRDDPTRARVGDTALNGWYKLDDEGVKGQDVVLVENGVLKTFLMSRRPVEGFGTSNGHGRSDGFQRPMARMGNLIVEGRDPISHDAIRARLLEEVRKQDRPYGLIVQTIAGGSTNTSSFGFQAFKGLPRVAYRVDAKTGEEELVRGFELVGTPLAAINKIVAVSDRIGVFNGYCGAESGSVPVSAVAPEALFAEMELQRSDEGKERAPVLPPPKVEAGRIGLRLPDGMPIDVRKRRGWEWPA